MDKVKKKNIIIIVIASLILISSGITFAYLITGVGGNAETDVDVASGENERLSFIPGEPLNIISNVDNFSFEDGSLSDTTTSKVKLVSEVEGETTTHTYNVYFSIDANEFIYTTPEKTPEIILNIIDPTGNEIKDITNFNYVTTTDRITGETIKGFDVTEFNSIIDIAQDYVISTDSVLEGVTHEWIFKLTYVNLATSQLDNEGKVFNGNVIMQNEDKNVFEFDYTGSEQVFTALNTGTYKVELWGAQGGNNDSRLGGRGAYTSGLIELNQGDTFFVQVGGQGSVANSTYAENSIGYNGGGAGVPYTGQINGTGGGGATDIRLTSGEWNNFESLSSRIMVAGAGAGLANWMNPVSNAAPGGGLIGNPGKQYQSGSLYYRNSTGGTQVSGGVEGYGAYGGYPGVFGIGGNPQSGHGSGGGGGYYGGGGGGYNGGVVGSGAGGSSFISGHTGSVAIASEIDQSPIELYPLDFNIRFIEVRSNGNSVDGTNNYDHTVEIQALLENGDNVALNKTIIGENTMSQYPLTNITDGITDTFNYGVHGNVITVDLEQEYQLSEVKLWRYYNDSRTYYETYVKVYNEDKTKSVYLHNYETDGTYAETSSGKTMSFNSCNTGTIYNECSVHYSNKVFTDTKMIDGAGYLWTHVKGDQEEMPNPTGELNAIGVGHSGNGYAKITYIP